MHSRTIYLELIAIYGLFLAGVFLIPGKGSDGFIELILTISSFIFTILLGFATANRRERFNLIRTTLRNDDAMLISVYESAKMFPDTALNNIQKLIDNYLIAQLDYKLVDYNRSSPSFLELYHNIMVIDARSDNEKQAKQHMLDNLKDSMRNQKQVIYAVKDRMRLFEWLVLILLCGIIIVCLFWLNTGEPFSYIVLPIISTSLCLLLLILRDLDKLTWQEDKWIWNPLFELFVELDLKPYVVGYVMDAGRIDVNNLASLTDSYRRVNYPNKYPDISGKQITIVELDK